MPIFENEEKKNFKHNENSNSKEIIIETNVKTISIITRPILLDPFSKGSVGLIQIVSDRLCLLGIGNFFNIHVGQYFTK